MEIFENTKKEIGGGNLEIYGLLRSTSLSQKVNKNIEIIQNITTKNILEKILSNYEDPMSTVFIVDPMIFWYESAKKALELKGAKFVEYNGDIDEVISELRLIQFSSTTQEVNLKDSSSSGFEERLRFRVENPLDDENWKEELFGPTVEKKYTDNELYNLASEVVMKENYASIPLLQSKLKVGYTKASELIDMLEKNGHIGPYEGTNSRAVIFQKDQNQEPGSGWPGDTAAEEPEGEELPGSGWPGDTAPEEPEGEELPGSGWPGDTAAEEPEGEELPGLGWPGDTRAEDPEDGELPGSVWPGDTRAEDPEDGELPGLVWPGDTRAEDPEDGELPGLVWPGDTAAEEPEGEELPGSVWPGDTAAEEPEGEELPGLVWPGDTAAEEPEGEELPGSVWPGDTAAEEPEGEELPGSGWPGDTAAEEPEGEELPGSVWPGDTAAEEPEGEELSGSGWPGDTRAEDPEDGELPGSGWPGSKSQILGNKLKSIFKIKGKTNNSGDSTTDEPLDLNVIQSRVGTLTIAVGGVRRGIGVTHHAIQIALYLSKFGNVACCELGNIEEATFWTFNPGKENPFNINNVDFHPCCSNYVNLVYSKKYDFVVLDIGSIKNQTGLMPISQEFVRASQKILISSSSIWDYQDLIKTIELLHLNNYLNGTHILMNFSNEKVFEDIQESLNIKQQDHFGIQLHKSTLRPDLFKDWDSELYRQIFGG